MINEFGYPDDNESVEDLLGKIINNEFLQAVRSVNSYDELIDRTVYHVNIPHSLFRRLKKLPEELNYLLDINKRNESNIHSERLKEILNSFYKVIHLFDKGSDTRIYDEKLNEQELISLRREIEDKIDIVLDLINRYTFEMILSISKRGFSEIDSINNKSKEIIEDISKKSNEANNVLLKMIDLPTKEIIDGYSMMYTNESISFSDLSKSWYSRMLICFGSVLVVSLLYIIIGFTDIIKKDSVSDVVQFNISKALILATLFYGLAICNKNYKASKHNEIVNKHKANALASFQAFVRSPSADKETKNAVLLEATKMIYSAQPTGYMPSDGDESPNKIVEIIQNSISKN